MRYASAGRGGVGCLEANKYSYTSFGCVLIGRLQQTKGHDRLLGCFMNEPRRYDTTS